MMKRLLMVLLFVLLFVSGGYGLWKAFISTRTSEIRITSNPWIGFTPFMYAQEKGWLEQTPFKFIWLVDLSDNARLFDKGFTQGFMATQYELDHLKNKEDFTTAFLIDQSYGADAILSNRSLSQLRSTDAKVDVYLEIGSMSQDMFSAFVRETGMKQTAFVFRHSSPKSMENMPITDKPMIVITYEPYASQMSKKGLQIVASTKTLKTFHAIDALFITKDSFNERSADYQKLDDIFKRAQSQLHRNPKEFYTTIEGYLEGESYDDFRASIDQIRWIGDDIPPSITQTLQNQRIPIDRLIR